MNENMLEEIINISNNFRLIDKDTIMKIARYEISKLDENTKKNFKYFLFVKNTCFGGMTNPSKGIILIDLENCYADVNSMKKLSILEKNLYIVSVVLHEIEHLKEENKIEEENIEGNLIYISDFISNYEKGRIVEDNYDNNPCEKIAFAKSWKKILYIANKYPNFRENYFDAYKYINNMYIGRLKLGYSKRKKDKNKSPLLNFIIATKVLSNLNLINFKLVKKEGIKKIDKFSVEQKFMYGFSVTEEDLKELNHKKIR